MLDAILGKAQTKTTIILPIYEMISTFESDKFAEIAQIIYDVFKENTNVELVFVGMDDKNFNTNIDSYFSRSTTVGGGSKTNTKHTKHKKLTKKHISKKVLSKRKQ